jgi:serine/threonine protein kinase
MGTLSLVKGRVLVVDDDDIFCELVEDMLRPIGYHVSCVHSILEMEGAIRDETFDVILLDLVLPREDGMSYLRRTKTDSVGVPIVVMTGNPQLSLAVDCFKEGAADCIFKPFTQGQLLEAFERSLKKDTKPPLLEKTIVMAPQDTPMIAGYPVKRIIGQGNMGIVYLVTGKDSAGRTCEYALKVLKPPMIGDPVALSQVEQRFLSEARATHGISHPNVIGTFDYGVCDNHVPYILMEYCPGNSLDKLIARGTLSLREKCHVLKQIAAGLCAIHDMGMCHRDIKPSNIIVTAELTAKIADFGLVRLGDSSLTMTSDVFGTPAYLSPEAFFSAKVDFRADQFSFGCLAYELVVGKPAFTGRSVCVVAREICENDPKWPRDVDESIPSALDAIIRRALQKNPAKRFDKTSQIQALLENCLDV